jgi:1,4-alpha-glucan branching enzyme
MLAAAAHLFGASAISVDIAVKSLATAQPPHMVNDVLVLSYASNPPPRFVGVRFEHESWKTLHPYTMNENRVYALDYVVPEGLREIRYRIEVDGLWMTDPANPLTDMDRLGTEFSLYTLEKEPVRPIVNPRLQRDGAVTFMFHGAPGRRVSLEGDFNNWDPFMTSLEESSPGIYGVTLRVPPGPHWYVFYSAGRRLLDRFNPKTGIDPDGNTVSYFLF